MRHRSQLKTKKKATTGSGLTPETSHSRNLPCQRYQALHQFRFFGRPRKKEEPMYVQENTAEEPVLPYKICCWDIDGLLHFDVRRFQDESSRHDGRNRAIFKVGCLKSTERSSEDFAKMSRHICKLVEIAPQL